MVPDFYHGKAMKPLDFSALPAFIAQFPRDKARRIILAWVWFITVLVCLRLVVSPSGLNCSEWLDKRRQAICLYHRHQTQVTDIYEMLATWG